MKISQKLCAFKLPRLLMQLVVAQHGVCSGISLSCTQRLDPNDHCKENEQMSIDLWSPPQKHHGCFAFSQLRR